MATIGESRAVVEIGRPRFGGLRAWLAWLALPGGPGPSCNQPPVFRTC
jgi:hypothetical protein